MVRMRHYIINIWKRESNFHENGTEIRECESASEVVCLIGQPKKKLEKHLSQFLLRRMLVQSMVC